MKSVIVFFFIALIVLLVAALFTVDFVFGSVLFGELRSSTFPGVPGRVRTAEVKFIHSSKGGSVRPAITYDYSVDGRPYTGSGVRFWTLADSPIWARDIVAQHPANSALTVYYNPAKPSASVLVPGLSGPNLLLGLFILPFNAAFAAALIAFFSTARNGNERPAAGLSMIREANRTRIRMPQTRPELLAFLIVAPGAMLVAAILGISSTGDPPVARVLAGWAAIIGLAALVLAWRWWKIRSGAKDLVLERELAQLTLPQTFGRKESVTAPFSSIQSLTVQRQKFVNPKSGGVYYEYAPSLRFKDGRQEENLALWADAARAEAFIRWLASETGLPVEETPRAT